MQRQTSVVKKNDVTRKWYVIDAANKPLGRLASQVAVILMEKINRIILPMLIVVIT